MDITDLFTRYIAHIIECEGTDFLDPCYPVCRESPLTIADMEKIKELYKDSKNDRKKENA